MTAPPTEYTYEITATGNSPSLMISTGVLTAPGGTDDPTEVAYQAMIEFAESRSLHPHELPGLDATVWPVGTPADRWTVHGSEWRP